VRFRASIQLGPELLQAIAAHAEPKMASTPHSTERIVTRRLYDFFHVPPGNSRVVNLARRVSTDGFQEINFVVRVHTGSIGVGASIQIQPLMDASTPEDPAQFFLAPINTAGFPTTFTLNNMTTFPALVSYNLPATGPYMVLRLIGTQPAIGATACNVTLSVDVVRKGGTRPLEPTARRLLGYRW
jgi:hypothetical protein